MAGKITVCLVCIIDLWFIHLWAQGLSKEDEYPSYTPHGVWCSAFPYESVLCFFTD